MRSADTSLFAMKILNRLYGLKPLRRSSKTSNDIVNGLMTQDTRVGDMHTCPMVTPPPHVGGPILPPGCPTVLIGGMPAARVGDMATCVGPPDAIALGSLTVLIGGQPAARMGDTTAHGGAITQGLPTVMIG